MHDDDEDLRKAMALSLQASERVVPAQRAEEEELQVALELSRQTSGGPASPSTVQLRLSQSNLAAIPKAGSHTAASMRVEQARHITPMRSWFSVPVPDVSDLSMVYPSPLRCTASGAAASTTSPRVGVKPPSSLLAPSSVAGSIISHRSTSRLGGQLVERGVGMVAAVSACLAGTWTDWRTSGVIQPKPVYCITIQPLEGQVLFGVHIVLLDKEDGRSEQHIVQTVEGGIEVVEGEAHFAGLTAELEYARHCQRFLLVSAEASHVVGCGKSDST